ncbi:hypothetical protein SmJEL517_g01641 [Synchytrium microbalum]|uniref:Chalcone isomerase domain-containing protein n=1 Tax=Synchytrium microbalum TaxID=1806994 RepID=A0A507C5K6_9FUNG|nr:uncharacterized protein SmJEL517_g01641 [Synchytrium microbalum]TPX36287.1 hypothetical protein SmJEL517_g01641 [Synchytrium microbalum]
MNMTARQAVRLSWRAAYKSCQPAPIRRNISTGWFPRSKQMHANSLFFGSAAITATSAILLAYHYHLNPSIIYADAAPQHAEMADSISAKGGQRMEPTTKTLVPEFIKQHYADKLGASKSDEYCHEFHLIGVGVRTVTFLYIPVYVASLYTNMATVSSLRSLPKWKSGFSIDGFLKNQDGCIQELLNLKGAEFSIRIEPVRNTNGAHLRNGCLRALDTKYNAEKSTMTDTERIEIRAALDKFASEFPVGTVKAGQVLAFTRKADGSFRFAFDGKELVTIPNGWLSKRFFEVYLNPEKAPSEPLRKNVAEGIEKILGKNK